MPERAAIFIDGAYLDHVLREESPAAKVDYSTLAARMAHNSDILRTYYYHCPPYQGNPPTEQQRARYAASRGFYSALERLPRFTVRLGRLEYRGDHTDGTPRFEQKRVDILLGVDIALLSAEGQIQQVILVAEDSDFIPAVEVAKNEGVLVTLFHGKSYHSDLWPVVDERYPIDRALIESATR